MGMFDDLWCQYPRPDGYSGDQFQTKSLDCELARYRITQDGAFEVFRFDEAPDGPRKRHWLLKRDYQPTKRVNERWEPVAHHGDIYFYGYDGDWNAEPKPEWHKYRARFTDGRLVSLVAAKRGELDV